MLLSFDKIVLTIYQSDVV